MESTVLVKAFCLLEALSRGATEHPLGQLAGEVHMAKPTAHRILGCLVDLGYVEKRVGGRYRLTGKLGQLSAPSRESELLTAVDAPMRQLYEHTGETTNLGVLRGPMVEYLKVLESNHPLRRVADVDSMDPWYCTALGRSMVALLPRDQQDELLAQTTLEKRTAHTIADAPALRRLLSRIRRDGYAIEQNETDIGVMCIGAPILREGRPVGALSVSVPAARADVRRKQELLQAVRDATATVSQVLTKGKGK